MFALRAARLLLGVCLVLLAAAPSALAAAYADFRSDIEVRVDGRENRTCGTAMSSGHSSRMDLDLGSAGRFTLLVDSRDPAALLVPAAGEADAAGRLDAVGHRIRRRERHRIRDRGLYPRSGAALRRPENCFYRRRERFFCQKTKKYDICNLRPGGLRPEPNS